MNKFIILLLTCVLGSTFSMEEGTSWCRDSEILDMHKAALKSKAAELNKMATDLLDPFATSKITTVFHPSSAAMTVLNDSIAARTGERTLDVKMQGIQDDAEGLQREIFAQFGTRINDLTIKMLQAAIVIDAEADLVIERQQLIMRTHS